jgi:hypothetical protein
MQHTMEMRMLPKFGEETSREDIAQEGQEQME